MRVSQQIGWSQEGKLIYEIIKQLRQLGGSLGTTNGQIDVSKEIGIKNDVNLYYEWLKELSRLGVLGTN